MTLRASDEDRDRVVAALRRATTEGYLTLDEFEERLDGVFRSRHLSDLDALLADIPGAPRPTRWGEEPVGGPRFGGPGTHPAPAPAWSTPWGGLNPFHAAVRLMVGLVLVVLLMSLAIHLWFPPVLLIVFGVIYWRRSQRRHHGADAV